MIILSNKRYDALIDKIFELKKENQDYSKVVVSVGGDYLDNKWEIERLQRQNKDLEQTVLTQSKLLRDLDKARLETVNKYQSMSNAFDELEAKYNALLASVPNRDEYEVQEDGSIVHG